MRPLREEPCAICNEPMSVWRDGPTIHRDPARCLRELTTQRDKARAAADDLGREVLSLRAQLIEQKAEKKP